MLRRCLLGLLGLAATLATPQASAQVFQSGGVVVSHTATWIAKNTLQDGGFASGASKAGQGIGELLQVNPAQPPGSGPDGTHSCFYSAPLSQIYSYFCIDAAALGGALIDVGGGPGGATGLNVKINNEIYPFPGAGNGNMVGPTNPSAPVGQLVIWNGGDTTTSPISAIFNSLNSLYFSNFSQLAGGTTVTTLTGAVSDSTGSFRDSIYFSITDSDTTTYSNSHTDYAGRFAAFGPYSGGWQIADKNIVAINGYALAATTSTPLAGIGYAPGVSGINTDAFQYGTGISDNEFAAHNPATASGHSISMAAVQGILDNSYAVADSTHTAYAFLASNIGTFGATAAYGASGSVPYITFMDAGTATVTNSGIAMPGSITGYVGTIIDYGLHNGAVVGGSWTDWLGNDSGGQYRWIDSGNVVATISTQGITSIPATGYDAFYAVPVSGTGNIAYAIVNAWEDGLNLAGATIFDAGIVLQNVPGASTIKYDATDYVNMRNTATWQVVVGNTQGLAVGSGGATSPAFNATGDSGSNGLYLANNVAIEGSYNSVGQSLLYLNESGTLVLGFGTGSGLVTQLIGTTVISSLASGGTQCVEVIADGQLIGTGSVCGSGTGGGMTTNGANSTGAAFTNIVTNSSSLTAPLILANGTTIAGIFSTVAESMMYLNTGNTLVLGFGTGGHPLVVQTLGPIVDSNLASSGTQCVEAIADGQLIGTGSVCGSGSGGGMNTNGSNATAAALAAIVGAQTVSNPITGTMVLGNGAAINGLFGSTSESLMYINTGGTLVLGFGTSGNPLVVQTLGPIVDSNLASSGTQCVHALPDGQLTGTGSDCGSGSPGMNTDATNASPDALTHLVATQNISNPITSAMILANNTAINELYLGTSYSLMYLNGDGNLVFGFGTGLTPLTTWIYGGIAVGAGFTAGVSCSGAPSGAFATLNGVVTHC